MSQGCVDVGADRSQEDIAEVLSLAHILVGWYMVACVSRGYDASLA